MLAALFGGERAEEALAKKRKKKRKKKQWPPEPCGGDTVCTNGRFCCDDEREICCARGASCCNIGPGTGFCCPSPNRCGRPWGNDDAPSECCPPERQWFTTVGLVRCCPEGTRSLGTGITSDDGPCCPEEKYCSQDLTGGKCCPDVAPVCLDRATGSCCNEEAACGDSCCQGEFGDCCGGECRYSEMGPWQDCGGFCCWAGATCCGEGPNGICCNDGLVCAIPCGDLPQACCTPEAFTNGACCNTDCGDSCGG